MKFTKVLSAAAALVLMANLAGCGKASDKDSSSGNSSSTSASDDSLQKVLDSGEFVLGLDASLPPMGFSDENN